MRSQPFLYGAAALAAAAATVYAVAAPVIARADTPAAQASAAATPAAAAKDQADAAPPAPRKATPEQRAMADRLEPLARAAFWDHEVNADPADTVAGIKLANALRALGQYQPAIEAASRVLVVDPNNFNALMESARAYVAEGQGFYAIDPANKAHALAAKDWRPLSILGVALEQDQRDDDAQVAWRQALTLSPDNPAVLANMAMSLAGRGQADQAEALLRRAVAQPSAGLQERQDLVLVLGAEGKLGEAEKILREDLPPDQVAIDLNYLQALAAGRNPPAAVQPAATPPAATARSWDSVKAAGG